MYILVKLMVEVVGFFGYSLPPLIYVTFWWMSVELVDGLLRDEPPFPSDETAPGWSRIIVQIVLRCVVSSEIDLEVLMKPGEARPRGCVFLAEFSTLQDVNRWLPFRTDPDFDGSGPNRDPSVTFSWGSPPSKMWIWWPPFRTDAWCGLWRERTEQGSGWRQFLAPCPSEGNAGLGDALVCLRCWVALVATGVLVACSGGWPTTALLLPPTSTRDFWLMMRVWVLDNDGPTPHVVGVIMWRSRLQPRTMT